MRKSSRLVASSLVWMLISAVVATAADHPMMGQPAPAFDLVSLDGDRVSSQDYRGRFIVLHFGAGW